MVISISQNVQSLFWRNPGKVPDNKLSRFVASPFFKALKIDANRDNVHFAFGNLEIPAHPLCVEIAHRKKAIDKLDVLSDQFDGFGSIGLSKSIDEQILTLQRAVERQVQSAFDRTRQRNQKTIWKIYYVGARFGLEPLDQIVELFSLESIFALQHRDRQFRQRLRIDRD